MEYNQNNGANVKPKSKLPVALILGLGMIVFVAVVFAVVFHSMFDDSDMKPFGGAKVKEQKIWETDGLIVSATELGYMDGDRKEQPALFLKINNGTSQDLVLRCDALSVNNTAMHTALAAEAAAGSVVDTALPLDRRSLYDLQIRTVGEIVAKLSACEKGSGNVLYSSGPLTIKTSKSKKSDEPKYPYSVNTFYEKDGIKLATTSLFPAYTDASSAVGFYVKNSTDRDILIRQKEAAVNGTPYQRAGSFVFPAGTEGTFYLELDWAELEAVLPMKELTGSVEICYAEDGGKITEANFSFIP